MRVALVEGLLAQTRARSVADRYEVIFDGVRTGADWLDLPGEERDRRLTPLGLGKQKRQAVDGIAEATDEGITVLWPQAMVATKGLGPYAAAMVALLHGSHAVPIDSNIDRVASRAARDADPGRWTNELLRAADTFGSVTGRPPAYEVASAVMDLGAIRCRPERVECPRCPLRPWCRSHRVLGTQVEIGLPDPASPWCPVSVSVPARAVNVDCVDWVARDVRLEAGWRRRRGVEEIRAAAAAVLVMDAVRGALGDHPLADTGELDFGGQSARDVAEAGARRLPGAHPWMRIRVGAGSGVTTGWGANRSDAIDIDHHTIGE